MNAGELEQLLNSEAYKETDRQMTSSVISA